MTTLVAVGIDAGGTGTRAVAVTADGVRVGAGKAGGGNPLANGLDAAVTNLADAVRAALGPTDPRSVTSVVLGLAGRCALEQPQVRQAYDDALRALGIGAELHVISDHLVAFTAGTHEPAGTVLSAGTGAVAAHFIDRRAVGVADGLGWQLGDKGSGFWIGRAAAKATARQLSRAAELGPLTAAVSRHILGSATGGAPAGGATTWAEPFVGRVQERDPIYLAELAPLVSAAAVDGDPVAVRIVRAAAKRLAKTVAEIRPPGCSSPIVLAGSVLTASAPVRVTLQRRLRRRWEAPVLMAGDTGEAAAWLAAERLAGGG
ncbi:BadF/BadG/BcrA/BcrD ATPase family protein [Phytoactinopolyspora mesophila]|uniref:ATPase n=1 Tax=Phytoactinopolyspora mesophila TaxID=2650750 RepID=A0A7K3M0N3_9ACTN|nr:ATPase [Phytoactinopolyspora mesophila]